MAWAAGNEIVTGYSKEKFGPDDAITREQLAAILYRYAQYKNIDVTRTADLSGIYRYSADQCVCGNCGEMGKCGRSDYRSN